MFREQPSHLAAYEIARAIRKDRHDDYDDRFTADSDTIALRGVSILAELLDRATTEEITATAQKPESFRRMLGGYSIGRFEAARFTGTIAAHLPAFLAAAVMRRQEKAAIIEAETRRRERERERAAMIAARSEAAGGREKKPHFADQLRRR